MSRLARLTYISHGGSTGANHCGIARYSTNSTHSSGVSRKVAGVPPMVSRNPIA